MYYRLRNQHNYIYYTGLAIIMFVIFILQSAPVFPRILSVLPLPLIPLVVCISVFNNELTGFVTGLCAGILMDITSPTVDGYNALAIMLIGLACGLLTEFLFNDRLLTTTVLCFAFLLLYYLSYWLIFIMPYGYQDSAWYLLRYSLPQTVYTGAFVVPFYYLTRYLHNLSLKEYLNKQR